ncbi:MAG: succinate dehydrogenase, hydrophobic membrane anchor protein [Paracoccaceae bacterium]
MSYKTDLARVIGLGSAKEGVGHWWSQRVTSVALIPLTVLALIPLAGAIGEPREVVLETYSGAFNAVVMMLFVAVTFRHLQQGLQVVIEDYVHGTVKRTAALLANTMLCAFFGLSGVFAVARIAFTGG